MSEERPQCARNISERVRPASISRHEGADPSFFGADPGALARAEKESQIVFPQNSGGSPVR